MQGTGAYIAVVANDATSVCCEDAMLATALRTVGVPLHDNIPFRAIREESGKRQWVWLFQAKSQCGKYETESLLKWWASADWHRANPDHEFAIVARVLRNHKITAETIRETPELLKLQREDRTVYFPVNASAAMRDHYIAIVEGRLPIAEPFTEPQ
jgi:hypothetical protein